MSNDTPMKQLKRYLENEKSDKISKEQVLSFLQRLTPEEVADVIASLHYHLRIAEWSAEKAANWYQEYDYDP